MKLVLKDCCYLLHFLVVDVTSTVDINSSAFVWSMLTDKIKAF
jgi:hypothetical protein